MTSDSLYAALSPDCDRYRVLSLIADAHLDEGDAEAAECLTWARGAGKWPREWPHKGLRCDWWWEGSTHGAERNRIPRRLYDNLEGDEHLIPSVYFGADRYAKAFVELVRGWRKLTPEQREGIVNGEGVKVNA